MKWEWIVIEAFAVLAENTAIIYFFNKRFEPKNESFLPTFFAWLCMIIWGLVATFCDWQAYLYEPVFFVVPFIYLITSKKASILQKIFGVFFSYAIFISTSMIGAGLATSLTDTTYLHSLENQDTARMLAIIFIKTLQIIVYYLLAKKRSDFINLKKRPALILCAAATLCAACIALIWISVQATDLKGQQHLLMGASIGLFVLIVALFVMYELFTKEEVKNIELQSQLQRIEIEAKFYEEIDSMYVDMRNWRHDYKNNLTALHTLVEKGATDKALKYIEQIIEEPALNKRTLQTGNLVLDAVVSSKLWLAHSKGIDIDIQAVYPESNDIEDNDLCSINGNLLDNAIEACERMSDTDGRKFIDFSLLASGKNLIITIRNSYNGELKLKGNLYASLKKGKYHGQGITYVDSIVAKYEGHIMRENTTDTFETRVLLPLINQERVK